MYSSSPFPHLPNSFFYHEKEDVVHYTHHHKNGDPFISGELLFHSSAPPPALENVTRINQDFVREKQQFSEGSGLQYSEDHSDLLDSVISPYKKRLAALKKDGHSKIYTARGPRDRRVRLSIDISRKFFCLQDLLGFDKASKTLDWLFSKSLTAIKELVEETSCSSSTLTDQFKVTFLETINGGSERKPVLKCVNGKKKKMTPRCKAGFHEDLARDQSRTEARARARERTREKLRVKNLDVDLKTLVPDFIMDQETLKLSKDSSFELRRFS